MNSIFFPAQYKKAILNKTKNTTIRINKEIGKYKVSKTYIAKSYAGINWNKKIKIIKTNTIKPNKLSEFGIPKRTINLIKNNAKVEVIRFKVL